MAATPKTLLTVALALPGVLPAHAVAQPVPEQGVIALKYLDYRDWQPAGDRIRVKTPALYVMKPLSDAVVVEGSLVYDSISGASPLYHDTLSGASGLGITDYRTAGDVKVTKYFGSYAIGVSGAVSSERDYLSRAGSIDVRWFSDDRNRTWALGLGGASDRIDSVNGVATGQARHTIDALVGVTQVLSAADVVQANVTYSTGHGYYSDPYKLLDTRPDRRHVLALLTRLNHHFGTPDATLKLSYRYLRDSFGDDAHTVEAAWVQPLPHGFSVTPSLRYTTQSAADFYFDPPFPRGFRRGQPYTADTRLSAFGAVTPGLKVVVDLGHGWTADLKWQGYRQQGSWRLGGDGSPGLESFSARWIEFGIARTL
ncbi:MAG: DUF3570 domain-containing protein [Pseudomonadota bacterium]|nr:DUF3570 domain-containing protein [Pseudomonadota bacterium]